jgi:signal peptidase I
VSHPTDLMQWINTALPWVFLVLTAFKAFVKWGMPSFRKTSFGAGVMESVDALWVALLVVLPVKACVVQAFKIPSASMENTLLIGDYLLVNKFEYGYSILNKTPRYLAFKKPKKGDILVFAFPKDQRVDYIKRCVGTPGDVIEVRAKDLYVNGVKQEEPYIKHMFPGTLPPEDPRDFYGPVTVQAGNYFMMGDNRDNSMDSRFWGQLDERLIKGRAWLIYWHADNFIPNFRRMFRTIR